MILGAGVNPETEQIAVIVELTDRQAQELGLPPEPALLGCGQMACAYLGEEAGEVIKITRDARDARMSWVVMRNPQPWAIPIRGVWRLPDGFYAIVADLADPLPGSDPALAAGFDWLWDQVVRQRLAAERWAAFRDVTEANLDDDAADAGGETDEIAARRRALALADEAVGGFASLGMGWLDFHSGNWALYGGRPVVIDLGLSNPLDEPPARVLAEARALPQLRDYPLPDERIGTLNGACPVVRASELSGGDLDRLKVRTVFATGAGVKKRALPLIKGPAEAAQAIAEAWGDSDREAFVVLLLNHRHRLVGVHESSVGSVAAVEVHPREALKAAVIAGASAVIVGHIHPSGDPTPSAEDAMLTSRLRQSADILGIKLLDHVVVGEDEWVSVESGQRGPLLPPRNRAQASAP